MGTLPVSESRTEWGDRRLDELAHRVESIQSSAATKSDLEALRKSQEWQTKELRRELTERAQGVNANVDRVGRKVDELVGDPVSEKRQRRQAIFMACCGALAGGAMTIILFIASKGGIK